MHTEKAIVQDYMNRMFEDCTENERKEKLLRSLERANNVRDFEIGLYWTRSIYFWGFQIVFFGAFGLLAQAVASIDKIKLGEFSTAHFILIIKIAVSILAAFVSHLWTSMLQGAKFWQDNWERHIDFLENSVYGPLYKTYFIPTHELSKDVNFTPISVTRVNSLISFSVTISWIIISITCGVYLWLLEPFGPIIYIKTAIGICIVAIVSMLTLSDYIAKSIKTTQLYETKTAWSDTTHQMASRGLLRKKT